MAATTSPAPLASDPTRPAGGPREQAAGERVGAFFEAHGRMVYGLCRLLLRDPVEADDATQATFLSAYRALLGGGDVRDPAAWLATIARNECRARAHARMRAPLPLLEGDLGLAAAPHEELDRHMAGEQIRQAISELPEKQREAVVLRDLYGMHADEVGAALGLSRASVESLLFRGRRRLRVRLKPLVGGALVVPIAVRDGIAQALPGFGASAAGSEALAGGITAGAAGGGLLAKLAAAPIAAKLTVAAVAVGAAGTATVIGSGSGRPGHPSAPSGPPAAESVVAGARHTGDRNGARRVRVASDAGGSDGTVANREDAPERSRDGEGGSGSENRADLPRTGGDEQRSAVQGGDGGGDGSPDAAGGGDSAPVTVLEHAPAGADGEQDPSGSGEAGAEQPAAGDHPVESAPPGDGEPPS
ncbi:sigma70-ECF: RNA polymerase sigma factor, sigma-70 family [Gaiella occulta]|uniref:Sigma70-ECF: RNA polymerase sigma factor, sigma-70 family n=1 Tax=Gaiella occulta TaxID=1002870 RepID=A0A7M2YYS8_9ACTN|nr:sigma-70 family RNA polymerase sigma factor [Gaiella occulta]RDI75240.1 sigma70-ECF: RNA polymerase sigma factor, sigma-70 family [Gaiella occulta]